MAPQRRDSLPSHPDRQPVSSEDWDYFPFNDRDFTSVAELTAGARLPAGPVHQAVRRVRALVDHVHDRSSARHAPDRRTDARDRRQPSPRLPHTASVAIHAAPPNPVPPHTFPYLVDKFFYTAYGSSGLDRHAIPTTGRRPAADGWYKMFEFFEVPSPVIGAIGPVTQGTNFDWAAPGLRSRA